MNSKSFVTSSWVATFLLPQVLFWIVLLICPPQLLGNYFSTYSLGLFVVVLFFFFLSFRLPGRLGVMVGLSFTLILFALTLSYKWISGFSDNFIIGGLLPYKDAKNYYYGASLILNGLPVVDAGQSTERPLFPGFLSSLLYITNWNLKVSLAIITQFIGLGVYLSARQIRNKTNVLASSLFGALLYFYIQPLIGYSLTESLGFLLGCFAFILMWNSSHSLKWASLFLGLFVLMLAVSARAGAFMVFPLLAVWAGWAFRHKNKYSYKVFFLTFTFLLAGYLLANSIYSRSLRIPPGSAFGNFSYAIYGQVQGGVGWHRAIDDLGTRDSSIVYRAALEFFLAHPFSLLIGFAKSYRDFFLVGDSSIFPFRFDGWIDWHSIVIWVVIMIFLLRGLFWLVKDFRANQSLLILAGFFGMILSIPFLPPVDGGSRFYASTVPFFFVVIALGITPFSRKSAVENTSVNDLLWDLKISICVAVILVFSTIILPPVVNLFSNKPVLSTPLCESGQEPFVMEIHKNSYIDLIKYGSVQCGFVPDICLDDFDRNNTEKLTDDFYQRILQLTKDSGGNARVVLAIDLIEEESHYFYINHDKIPNISKFDLMSGCALEIKTKNQSIYQVESLVINGN